MNVICSILHCVGVAPRLSHLLQLQLAFPTRQHEYMIWRYPSLTLHYNATKISTVSIHEQFTGAWPSPVRASLRLC